MSGTSHPAGPPGASKRILGEGTSSDIGPVKRQKLSKYHAAAGLKLTIHGNVYQLKLLTLFLKRGLKLKYSFILATELVEAEKFDDIVFGYTDENDKDVCRFLQAKHKQDETKKITLRDLLTEKDDEFSIKKYFISYGKIKQNLEFKGYYLQDFTICTNINVDENLANNFEEITGTDDILHFEYHNGFRRYKINLDRFPKKDELLSILRRTSEHLRLANMLAVRVLENKPLKLSDLFKSYHGVLGKKVIDVEVGKFRNEFIDGERDQSSVFERFRKSFYEEYQRVSKTQIDENEFWVKMKDANLKTSSTFGKKFELDPNPVLTADKEALAEKIAKAIKVADKNIVKILREPGKQGVIKANIDKLAGYVFVKKEDQNKEFHFNSKFLDENEKLPCHLEEFRTKFMEKLEDEGIEFSKMKEYKFCITSFLTCEEGQLDMKPSLPDDYIDDTDIQGFFECFVLSVNQPNEEELGDIIQDEIGDDFKLIDSELMASKLQEDMLNWMKEKKGRFLTNEEGNKLFEVIHQKVSKLVLIGSTLVYLAKIEQFQISFREDLKELRKFLDSEEEQIFNLISSCDDTVFSSIKVLQTLKNTENYQTDDSYIYMRLDSLLYIRERVMKAFSSGTSKLLAIECKAKKNEVNSFELYKQLCTLSELCKQLCASLKIEKDKKIILITLKNDIFAEELKKAFTVNNHYKEIKDEKVNLTHLTDKSQEKILTEGKVIFLGKEVSLDAVIDVESTHLLSGEVLSMVIKNDKLELGKPPIDPKHIEVEDYFIDRTLIRYEMIESDFMKEKNFLVLDVEKPDRLDNWRNYVKIEIESKHGSCTDIIIISDTCDEFIELREEYEKQNEDYRKQHSIHWLKKEEIVDNGYRLKRVKELNNMYIHIWKQSCGDLSKLRRFINTSKQSVEKYKLNKITDVSDKVVIVAAEPGMGKSALLSHLSLETQSIPPPLWIVRINLIDDSNKFSDWLNDSGTMEINVLEAVKFLYKIIFCEDVYLSKDAAVDGKIEDVISLCLTQNGEDFDIAAGGNVIKNMTGSSFLQIKLFAHFFNKGKVVLLFDGFDEISPHYNNLVVKLLKVLKDTKVRSLWLTTRPYNILREPENQFSTFAYTLQPFLKEDQNNFLKKYWTKNGKLTKLDEEKVDIFINKFVNQFSITTNDPYRKFTSIPLQILMLADTLSDKFDKIPEPFWENKDALANKLDLVTLYENFLKKKLDIELEKIIPDERDKKKSGMLSITEKERLDFRKSHEILAVYLIFEVDQCKKVLSTREVKKIKKLKRLISKAENKTGVIINIVDDKPEFIHRTFAEYFAAQFIWKKISTIKLEVFKKKIVRDIVVDMLIEVENGAIQVSTFLALIAKEYFSSSIDLPTWESKIEILLMELTNQIIEEYDGNRKNNFQSTNLLLGIIEFFLLKQDSKVIILPISANQSTKLLCVCAKMGYIKIAEALTNLNTELLKKHLSQRQWRHCPVWLAAENGHLDIMKFLVERFSYHAEWQDKDGKFLIQCIFQVHAFKVLKSCLELNIIDCGPIKGDKCERLPIHEAVTAGAPAEVIKLLLEKTDDGIVNRNTHIHELPVRKFILHQLVTRYHKPVEIIELALIKGVDFSYCLNDVLRGRNSDNVRGWGKGLSLQTHTLSDCSDFIESFFPVFSRYNHSCNMFLIVEQLFKAGIGYSYIDPKLGLDDPRSDTTYRIVKVNNDMHKLLYGIYNLCKQNNKENHYPRQILFRFIFNYIRSLGFEAVEITINEEELRILPHYQENCEHKFHILNLISRVIWWSTCLRQFYEFRLKPDDTHISVTRWQDMFCHLIAQMTNFPECNRVMTELFFQYYVDGDNNMDLMKRAVDELKNLLLLVESRILSLPVHQYSFWDNLREMYDKNKILENVDAENEPYIELLNKLVKSLFHDVLLLYYYQGYTITDALEEISEKVIKLEKVFNKLLEMKKKGEHSMILDKNQILDILGLENIACELEDLQKLVSEICDTSTGICKLTDIWFTLNKIGQQHVIPTIQQWMKLSDEPKQIFDLFKELHEGYENIICAVKEDDIDKVTSMLQNVEQDFVKAIIHGLDEHYGSPLHYAALNGQADIINTFLDHGANPNLKLCNNFEKITHFSQAVEKMKKAPFPSVDFINWTPLYFAVLNDHLEVVQNLIERGADVNYVLNPSEGGYSALHISAVLCGSLEIAQLLIKNGAYYNFPNREGKTPLDLATSGSDIERLLRSIHKLFRIVEWGGTNAVNSVFEVLNFDSWKAVLNTKNTDDETRLELTENNAPEDIFELLSESDESKRISDLFEELHEGYENPSFVLLKRMI